MKKFNLRPTGAKVSAAPAFSEASADELRVLFVLLEEKREVTDEEIAAKAGVSAARASSAATLWQEAGILTEADRAPADNTVTDVYADHIDGSSLMEESGEKIAEVIRRKKLAALFSELAKMMEKPMLSDAETRKIAALVSQYGVGAEYIAALASHIAERGTLSVTSLVNRAIRIADGGVLTVEALLEYLANREAESGALAECKRILGIFGRALSKTEREAFLRWTGDYGFGTEVIGEAYDITALNTNAASIPYMEKMLADWHEKGCKTVEEVRALREKESAEKAEAKAKNAPRASERKKKAPALRYGEFDPEEALKAALARSYEKKN